MATAVTSGMSTYFCPKPTQLYIFYIENIYQNYSKISRLSFPVAIIVLDETGKIITSGARFSELTARLIEIQKTN